MVSQTEQKSTNPWIRWAFFAWVGGQFSHIYSFGANYIIFITVAFAWAITCLHKKFSFVLYSAHIAYGDSRTNLFLTERIVYF
jgi:hypothetical protein